MINQYIRYQVGLTLGHLFPSIKGKCACGCNKPLSKNRRKWHSDECLQSAYLRFAIIKGDVSVIREQVYLRDGGKCKCCGVVTENWHADHIKPVYLGGGACSLNNIQTLCVPCHKIKTYNLSHHNAISSHAASIFRMRILYALGHDTILSLNTSKEKQSFVDALSPKSDKYFSAYK